MADADGPLDYRCRLAASPRVELIAGSTVPERLHSAVDAIGGRIVLTTGFGMEAQLIAHHVFTEGLPVEVVTLDTGRLFPETHDVWHETEQRYGVRIRGISPDAEGVRAMVADSGINGFYYSRDARLDCCHVRKVQPLKQALEGASAWIVGLRSDQSRQRSSVRLARWDEGHRLIKLAPLFDSTRESVEAECKRLGVPVNALHSRGFPSIGCAPCTRAVAPGEEERSGRWWWEGDQTKECGLHGQNGVPPRKLDAA